MARGVTDASGNWFHAIVGTYDDRGNVVKEELFGNLTGCHEELFSLGADHRPVGTTDCYAIQTAYSNDGFNLPLCEVHDDGKVVRYAYAPNSNRLISVLTGGRNHILCRKFHRYNCDGILVETIHDDGNTECADDLSGVTTRHITLVTPRRTAPAIGLPDSIVEQYWDGVNGIVKQLKRKQFRYNNADLIEEETVYDANDQLSYSIHYAYDEKRNLIAKSDPVGRVTRWTYDINKNKVSEELVGSGSRTLFRYDLANRRIASECIHDDGERYLIQYQYDYLGNKIAEIDAYGNTTKYVYDAFSRLIEVHHPQQTTENGVSAGVTKNAYNALDQVIIVTDPDGHITRTAYNQRGQPILVIHPDGSQQRREYNLNGTLSPFQTRSNRYQRCVIIPVGFP